MYPKVVALDTDWTIFHGWLRDWEWGKGPGAKSPNKNNIEEVNYWDLRDRTDHSRKIGMYADIPKIIQDILKHNAKLAIVSRNTSKDMCDRAMYYWKVKKADGHHERLIKLVDYDEIYDKGKTHHFKKIKGWAKCHYTDMIHFDDEAINNYVEMLQGVTFQVSRDQKGLTWENYQHGISMWKRNKAMEVPWHGPSMHKYHKRKFIGWSGMDIGTINQLEKGKRRKDRTEAARWGYAMYVTDKPAIAKFFADWIKGNAGFTESHVCEVYARDGAKWSELNKIFVPEVGSMMIDVEKETAFNIAWSQENRDDRVRAWGVKKPYVLFSQHFPMNNEPGRPWPLSATSRWTEMVVYPQIQEAMIVINRLSSSEVDYAIQNNHSGDYYNKLGTWNITVPQETWQDFANNGEGYFS